MAAVVEEGRVLHLGKRFVGVGIIWGALHSGPGAHTAAPPDNTVDDQAVLSQCGVAKEDGLSHSRPCTNLHTAANTDVGSKDRRRVNSCGAVDEDIANNGWTFCPLTFAGKLFGACCL